MWVQPFILAESSFRLADWLVVAGYFALLAATGIYLSRRRQHGTEDYFLAGRSMPAWAVALSVLATAQSAATFIGAPESAYRGNLTYLSANIGQVLAAVIVALFFIPVLYRHRVATVYELLERQVGRPSRLAASGMFMVGRVFASGARLFMGALAGAMILYGDIEPKHVVIAIGLLVLIGISYTLVGGIRSVIWADVIQACVYIGAAIAAIVVLLYKIPAGFDEIHAALQTGMADGSSKLTWLTHKFDGRDSFAPKHTFTLWTGLIGFALLNLGFYGTDHDGMQRMLTCKSATQGAWSMIGAILIGIPVTLLFMVTGLLLWVFYKQPVLMGNEAPLQGVDQSLKVFLQFIMNQMPPGLAGLMMAGLIAAGLSSLNSALNAMSSAFVNDFYRHLARDRGEAHYLRIGRLGVVGFGVLLGAFAIFCIFWQGHSNIPLIDFALMVMAFAYSGLVAVYLTVLFTRRGSNASVIAALVTGFGLVFIMQPSIWTKLCSISKWSLPTAQGAEGWTLGDLRLAFPWQLTIATLLAFLVCCLGRRGSSQSPCRA